MKSTTATTATGAAVVIVWIWNTLIPVFSGAGEWWPVMPAEVATVLNGVVMALGAHFWDKVDG